MPPLGRQGRRHVESAQKWLSRASAAAEYTRGRCGIAFAHLMKSQEALGFAWAHIDSIGTSGAADRRIKRELAQQHRDISRKIARGYTAFEHRCIRRRSE